LVARCCKAPTTKSIDTNELATLDSVQHTQVDTNTRIVGTVTSCFGVRTKKVDDHPLRTVKSTFLASQSYIGLTDDGLTDDKLTSELLTVNQNLNKSTTNG
jgi:hypothetical protein